MSGDHPQKDRWILNEPEIRKFDKERQNGAGRQVQSNILRLRLESKSLRCLRHCLHTHKPTREHIASVQLISVDTVEGCVELFAV